MKTIDFGFSYVYPEDKEFMKLLKDELKKRKKTFYDVNYNNIDSTIDLIDKKKLHFRVFVDLSSFENPVFAFLIEKLHSNKTKVINEPKSILVSFNKSKLHNLLKSNNLPLRKTFILNPKEKNKEKLRKIIKILKEPFVLSPAISAFEKGVILNAREVDDILAFLEDHSTEDTLVHEYITPKVINEKVSWFRPIYSNGKIICHWWDPQNSFYQRFKKSKEENKIKLKLENYIKKIADLTGLELFSTEIVINQEGKYIVLDYANNPIDLSSQEYERGGVPKETLIEIAKSIANLK